MLGGVAGVPEQSGPPYADRLFALLYSFIFPSLDATQSFGVVFLVQTTEFPSSTTLAE